MCARRVVLLPQLCFFALPPRLNVTPQTKKTNKKTQQELSEGRYAGQAVPRAQRVLGVEFSYQPPPKNVVPYAASLKGTHPMPHK